MPSSEPGWAFLEEGAQRQVGSPSKQSRRDIVARFEDDGRMNAES